jgi:maltooligosyltrehalose trehalohydrolase
LAKSSHADGGVRRLQDRTFRLQRPRGVDGALLGPEALVLRSFGETPADDLLLVNLGLDQGDSRPEPLLAPPAGLR